MRPEGAHPPVWSSVCAAHGMRQSQASVLHLFVFILQSLHLATMPAASMQTALSAPFLPAPRASTAAHKQNQRSQAALARWPALMARGQRVWQQAAWRSAVSDRHWGGGQPKSRLDCFMGAQAC